MRHVPPGRLRDAEPCGVQLGLTVDGGEKNLVVEGAASAIRPGNLHDELRACLG